MRLENERMENALDLEMMDELSAGPRDTDPSPHPHPMPDPDPAPDPEPIPTYPVKPGGEAG